MMSKSTSEPIEPDKEVQESAWSQSSATPEKTSAVDNSQHPSSQSADDSLPIVKSLSYGVHVLGD